MCERTDTEILVMEYLIECGIQYTTQQLSIPYSRVFILNSVGATIGRITFKNKKVCAIKCYKKDYIHTIDETDFIFMGINKYVSDGIKITKQIFEKLILQSQKEKEKNMEEKKKYRENHKFDTHGRIKKRKALVGKNIRFILKDAIRNY